MLLCIGLVAITIAVLQYFQAKFKKDALKERALVYLTLLRELA